MRGFFIIILAYFGIINVLIKSNSNMLNQLIEGVRTNKWSNYSPVFLRVALGVIFLWHGYDKVSKIGIDGVSGFLGGLGFPMSTFFAYVLSYGEIIAGIMLILGLYTYIAAKYAAIVAFVALFAVHAAKGFDVREGGYEYIMLILVVSVSVFLTGPGQCSLDQKFKICSSNKE